ncbi:MAG: AgmX/PglI C-terminal domain-containing protein [Bacteroidetes bacterium]|nr:AgmX/PglI C-terminal domain-containing protein [Bacteroidota bacterium]
MISVRILATGILLSFFSTGFAQIYTATGRLAHSMTADMQKLASYKISFDTYGSFLPGTFTGQSASGALLSQNYIGFDYGITDNFQLSAIFNVMQMNHSAAKSTFNAGPVTIGMKLGNLAFLNGRIQTGFIIGSSFAIGDLNNVPFYPYYSGTVEVGIGNITSWYLDAESPEQGQSLHFNAMLMNHNENQLEVSKTPNVTYEIPGRAVGIKYALGYLFPYGSWNFYSEIWGEMFYKQPDKVMFSRESYSYLNAGFKYKYTYWELNLSVDAQLMGFTDETDYVASTAIGYPKVFTEDKNYSPYFVNMGVVVNFSDIVNSWMGYSIATYNYNLVTADKYTDDLRKDDVLTKIEMEYYRTLYECFRGAKRFDENIKGTLYIDFTVKPDGTVENQKVVISTFDSALTSQVEDCMISQVKDWVFPKGEKPLRFEILPLNFK